MDYEDIDRIAGEPNGQSIPNASSETGLSSEKAAALRAITFMKRFHPATLWVISSFGPGENQIGPTRTFDPAEEEVALLFVESLWGQQNLYFSVNCVNGKLTKKASKADIAEVRYLHIDIDLKDLDWSDAIAVEAAKTRVLTALRSYDPPPTVIVFTGGGYQAFWLLSEIIHVSGDKELMKPVERRIQRIERILNADACHNLDRVMRLPGTMNVLSRTKITAGRKPAMAEVVEFHEDRIYDIEDFPEIEPTPRSANKVAARPSHTVRDETERVRDALRVVPADDYGIYFRVVAAIKSEFGDAGFEIAREWAKGSDKFEDAEFRRTWAAIKIEGGITIATLFGLAHDHDWRDCRRSNRPVVDGGIPDAHCASNDDDEPLPLLRKLPAANPYPVDALGPLKDAVLAIHATSQAPVAICANAVISTAALAGQSHVDVLLPTGQTRPISVDMLTIALSGERKTTVDNFAVNPVKRRQLELREKYDEEIVQYVAEHKAWEAQTRKIGNDKKLGYREQRDKIASLGPEPLPPLTPLLLIQEPTVEGLTKLLDEDQPSIGIFTSEGGAFIGGHGFAEDAKLRTAAILSLLWDDGTMSRVRAGDGAKAVEGKRVSMHLQAQPDVGARFFCDRVLMDQGIVWRFLIAAPESTQGQRFWQEIGSDHHLALDCYYQKLTELLKSPPPLKPGKRNELDPRPLKLSAEARELWITLANEIEGRVAPGGDLVPIAGFANKLAEHATRLAGILTIYEDPQAAEITKTAMQNGYELATYYAQTAIRLRAAAHVNADLREAEDLLRWLHERWEPAEGPVISLPDLVQLGPSPIRDTRKAKHLIGILESHRHLRRLEEPYKVKGKIRRDVWEIRK